MTSVSIDLTEWVDLQHDIGRAGDMVEARAPQLVAKAASDIEATAQGIAPVDTGNLKNSIGSDVDGLDAEIGPTAEYGAYVEDGTSRMAAQPYMGPAADVVTPKLVAAVADLGGGALSATVGRGRRG